MGVKAGAKARVRVGVGAGEEVRVTTRLIVVMVRATGRGLRWRPRLLHGELCLRLGVITR